MIGQTPRVSKSNRLHDFDDLSAFLNSFEAYYSIDSSKTLGNLPEVLNLNHSFLNSNSGSFVATVL
jgi:hypothetical protein